MRKLMYLFILLFITNKSIAQTTMTVPSVDKETYELYLAKDWNKLIKTGKKALKNGVDFYYLNYRMGIAYYEKQNYIQAVKYFKKTHKTNSDDDTLNEYLYYSYLFAGRYDQARNLGYYFTDKMKTRLGIRTVNPFFSSAELAYKVDFIDDYSYDKQLNEDVEQQINQKQTWYGFGLEHLTGAKTTIMGAYSKVNTESFNYDIDSDLPEEYIGNVAQNQYYIALKQYLGSGFSTALGLHLLSSTFSSPTITIQRSPRGNQSSSLYFYEGKSFVAAANISKSFLIFNTTLETSIANLNNKTQLQPSLGLRIYPFGNAKFYSDTKGIYISENDNGTKTNYTAIKQSFAFKIKKYSFISSSVTFGELVNYTDFNASLVNNNVDILKLQFNNYLNIGFNNGKFNLFANYQYSIKENTYKVNDIDNSIEYNSQSILFGAKWYF